MSTLSEVTRNARVIAGIAHGTGVPVIASVDPSLGGTYGPSIDRITVLAISKVVQLSRPRENI